MHEKTWNESLSAYDLKDFCGTETNTSSWTKWIFNSSSKTFTSCAEFGVVFLCHAILLFFTVTSFFRTNLSSNISNNGLRRLLYFRVFTLLVTVTVFVVDIVYNALDHNNERSLQLFERVVAAGVYALFTLIWLKSLKRNTWKPRICLSIAYNMTVVSIWLITYQTIRTENNIGVQTVMYGTCSVVHLINVVLQVYEFSKDHSQISFERMASDSASVFLEPSGDEGAGFFSRLFFCWVNPLIIKGYRGELRNVSNLFRVPPSLRVAHIENIFFENAPDEVVDNQKFSLAVGLLRSFGLNYFLLGLLRLTADLTTFAGPVLLHLLIVCLEDGDSDNYGFIYACFMMGCAFASAVSDFSFNFYMNKVALKVRCACLVALYDKLLTLPQHQLSKFSSGQLINFMSTDLDRVVSFVTSFHAFWSMPVNIAVALYLLYREMGLAFLSGLMCAIFMVPLNNYVATKIGKMSQKMMHYKDQRMKLVQEVIRSMKTVKLSNWESFFEDKINKIREKELHYLKARKYLDAVCVYLWASAPLLITITILTTYTLIMKEQLTAAKVFTSLALVNILIMPLNAFPWVFNSLIEARVSKKRLDRFFDLTATPLQCIYSLTENPDQLLALEGAKFEWSNGFTVGDVTCSGNKGTIIGVSGAVASGKSTFLLGLLGETLVPQSEQPSVHGIPLKTTIRIRQTAVNEGFAYVGQDCWVRRGTIRDNIVCGSNFNEQFYRKVLYVTALSNEVERFPGGDQYVIADDGTTLSGGQRARLALARALYQENEIYLLDDPFASLDNKVGQHIWKYAIEGMLKQQNRLVIIATHNTNYLRRVDQVIKLDAFGRVEEQVIPLEQVTAGESDHRERTEQDQGPHDDTASESNQVSEESSIEECVVATPSEDMEAGTVKLDVYWFYLSAVGFGFASLVGAALLAMQTSKNLADAWLSKWTLNSTRNSSSGVYEVFLSTSRQVETLADSSDYDQAKFFLTVYVLIGVVNTVFTLLRAFLFAKGGVVAAKNLHESLLSKVFTTPWGRVVNRLCSDVYMVDDSLPFQLNICLASFLNLCGALILTVFALPFIIPIVLILLAIYYFIQKYYRFTTCEVKRITSLTLSPLYGHISDTVVGLVTIRAFRFSARFMDRLRILLEDHLSAQYTNVAASQWLSIRLQLLAVFMVSAIAHTAVIENKLMSVESGLIGLSITYALTMTNVMNSLLSSFIDTEKELVSVERMVDYLQNIPNEGSDRQSENLDRFLFCRNAKGSVDFVGVCLRYAAHLPLALSRVTFHIDAGRRVAIIGRTGAGKSSIFQCLLRAHSIESGKIFIDGTTDIGELDPKAARSLFGVVNQTPFIFSGTISDNIRLDNESASDAEILELLGAAGLSHWLDRWGGLEAEVVEGGANFSHGERQIIQVCRLVISKPKVVLIDEATAHMDDHTHIVMTNLIRTRLETATVISIVHRLKGLEAYDWVLEMDNGCVVSEGPPENYVTAG